MQPLIETRPDASYEGGVGSGPGICTESAAPGTPPQEHAQMKHSLPASLRSDEPGIAAGEPCKDSTCDPSKVRVLEFLHPLLDDDVV